MPFKSLEHDGDEDYDTFSVRQDVKRERKVKVKKKKETEHERLEEEQKRYLSPSNPLLWTGDFDE